MSFTKGFSFRAASGGQVDAASDTYVLASDTYPVTRNSVTFGWDSSVSAVDRDATPRLGGLNYISNTAPQRIFQADMAGTGTTDVNLANGDFTDPQGEQYWEIRDNTTLQTSLDDAGGTAGGHFNDATGVDRTSAAWSGSNAAFSYTAASSTFKFYFGKPVSTGAFQVLAYIGLNQSGGGGAATPTNRRSLLGVGT